VQDRARTQFLSAVLLVVVFSAGGLVGAAVSGNDRPTTSAPVALPAPEAEGQGEEREDARRNQYMFERAGATEAQAERIRSEILPWYQQALEDLWADSTVQALDHVRDSLRGEFRAADRAIEDYYDPRREALTDSARALIRAALDPAAQLVYDSLVNERNRRNRDGGDRHP